MFTHETALKIECFMSKRALISLTVCQYVMSCVILPNDSYHIDCTTFQQILTASNLSEVESVD